MSLSEMWSTHIGRNPRLAARLSSGQWSETAIDNLYIPQSNEDYFTDSDFEPDSAEGDDDDYDYEMVQKSGFLVEL